MTKSFIPRFESYEFPSDEDYEHFTNCEVRNSGRLFECRHCIYVWNHWYGTTISFNESE
jgi:hypothetical protein